MAYQIELQRYYATMALLFAEQSRLNRNGGRLAKASDNQRQAAAYAESAHKIRDELAAPINIAR